MRKFVFTLMALLGAATIATAQTSEKNTTRNVDLNGFWDNWFVGLGAGTHSIATTGTGGGYNGRFTPITDIYVGKWFSPEFGARVGVTGGTASQWGHNPMPGVKHEAGEFKGSTWQKETVAQEYGHADLLWNFSNTVAGYNPYRVYCAVPYITLGGIFANKTEGHGEIGKTLAAGAGLLNVFRVNERINITLDLRTMAYGGYATGDAHARNAVNASALAGLAFNLGAYGWNKTQAQVDIDKVAWNQFFDNWFVSGGFGVASMASRNNGLGYNGRITPAVDVMVGKWFSPSFGTRLGYQGMTLSQWGREPKQNVGMGEGEFKGQTRIKEKFGYAYTHADLLWNFSATVAGYKENRVYEFIPYVHMGSFIGYDILSAIPHRYTPILTMAGGVGLLNNFYAGERTHIYVDMRALRVSGRATGDAMARATYAATATMGLTYDLGGYGWNHNRADVDHMRRQWNEGRFQQKAREEATRDVVLNGFGANWFIGMAGGVISIADTGTGNRWNGRVTPAGDVYFAKWFSPAFGARVGLQGDFMSQWAHNPMNGTVHQTGTLKKNGATAEAEKVVNLYAHADILWSLANTFGGYRSDRVYDMIPYVHYGVTRTSSVLTGNAMARGFMGGLGLINDFSISDRMGIFVDARAALFQGKFTGDKNANIAGSITALAGMRYNIGTTGWQRRPLEIELEKDPLLEGEMSGRVMWNGLFENWFIGYSAGVNTIATRRNGLRYNGRITPAEEITVGKWFNPRFGVRGGLQGMKFSEWHREASSGVLIEEGEFKGQPRDLEEFAFAYAHGDFLWNFSNTVAGYKPNRVYEAIPYIHVGMVGQWSTNSPETRRVGAEFTGGLGMLNSFHLNPKVDIFLDTRASVYSHDFIKDAKAGQSISATAMVGVNYRLGRKIWEPAVDEYDDDFQRLRRWAISTNLLGWADLGTANLEAQYALGRHITLDAMGRVNAWSFKKGTEDQFQDQKHTAAVGIKIWPWYTYSGLWIRTAGQVATYATGGMAKFQKNERGDAYGGAVSIGYALMLAPGFNLDFGIGGWAGYKNFRSFDSSTLENMTGRDGKFFVAPNELSVSLMFVF